MSKKIDLVGQTFGRLTVIKQSKSKKQHTMWVCQCECGNTVIVDASNLQTLHTKSCGCYRKEIKCLNQKHGMSNTRLHRIWTNMLTRAYNPNYSESNRYSERGISVIDDWRGSSGFIKFADWAVSNGYNDKLTLDRIDNNKGYSPSNCRWAEWKIQQRNRGNNIRVTYNGEEKTLIEWSEILNFNYKKVKQRLYRGWDIERAFTTP
jgi:hypothetical protein